MACWPAGHRPSQQGKTGAPDRSGRRLPRRTPHVRDSRPLPGRSRLILAVDKAELVSLGIRHDSPAVSILVVVVMREPHPSEFGNPCSRRIDILDGDIQMNAILRFLGLRHSLKADARTFRRSRGEIHILRRAAKPVLNFDAQHGSPERGKPLRVMTICLNPTDLSDGIRRSSFHCRALRSRRHTSRQSASA